LHVGGGGGRVGAQRGHEQVGVGRGVAGDAHQRGGREWGRGSQRRADDSAAAWGSGSGKTGSGEADGQAVVRRARTRLRRRDGRRPGLRAGLAADGRAATDWRVRDCGACGHRTTGSASSGRIAADGEGSDRRWPGWEEGERRRRCRSQSGSCGSGGCEGIAMWGRGPRSPSAG
jgi:hypothetical protein